MFDIEKTEENCNTSDFCLKFTLPVIPITKKNHQVIRKNRKTGKPFITSSERYKIFEKEVVRYTPNMAKIEIDFAINVKVLYYVNRNARVDKTNLESAIMDALVKATVIKDDSAIKPEIVVSTDGSRVYYDKENPRIEIEITKVGVTKNGNDL